MRARVQVSSFILLVTTTSDIDMINNEKTFSRHKEQLANSAIQLSRSRENSKKERFLTHSFRIALLIIVFCSQLNQSEFQDMDDETRVQYEGFRPGMYVRVEVSPKIHVLILVINSRVNSR